MPNDLYNDLPLTNFPSSVDQFMTFLNIVASDGPLIAQYQQAMEAGNTTLANQILTQIPQGTQKIITATDLNTLSQAMLAVERFYLTDIKPYVQNLQQNWLSVINQFTYKGVWQSGTSYVTNNLVSYTVSGLNLVYIALSDVPVGTAPTNQTYWRLLTIQGQAGASGAGLSYRQEWNNSTTYSTNDAVTYDGSLWMALQPSQNREPSSSPQYWKMVMSLETTTYPIQDTEPTNLQVEGLWFNTSNNPTKYYYLASLTNPATNANIQTGYQAYDSQGNLLSGTYSGSPALPNPSTYEDISPTVSGSDLRLSYTFDSSATVQNGTVVNFDSPLSNFGNATAADVASGKTFTSSNGLNSMGTATILNNVTTANVLFNGDSFRAYSGFGTIYTYSSSVQNLSFLLFISNYGIVYLNNLDTEYTISKYNESNYSLTWTISYANNQYNFNVKFNGGATSQFEEQYLGLVIL